MRFDHYQFNLVIIKQAEDAEIREMFCRLQNGKPLNSAEKRNAMKSDMRDFCAELSQHDSGEGEHLEIASVKCVDLAYAIAEHEAASCVSNARFFVAELARINCDQRGTKSPGTARSDSPGSATKSSMAKSASS